MKALWCSIALAVSSPAHAQSAPDPIALAAARPVIDQLWPLGTYRRLMDGTMTQMMDSMMDQMLASRASDLLPADPKLRERAGSRSLAELAAEADPHFRERMRITNEVMWREMLPLFDQMEPAVRESLTVIYARKFTPAQLADLRAFLGTPTGQVYGREWMVSFMDPEVMKNVSGFAPELMKAMPSIMAKVTEATKHLPAPKRKKNDE